MIIGTTKETQNFETRVPITPQTVSLLKKQGFDVIIESKSGEKSLFSDTDYKNAGATITLHSSEVLNKSDILFKINAPSSDEIRKIKPHCTIIGNLQNLKHSDLTLIKKNKITCFALERLPRISRAQPFDILSSQNNLAGYQAVIKAASLSSKTIPLMTTSAGTLPPLKFLIIGVGISGLQAIATAKRLGGKVYATDVRKETQAQIISLGATYLSNIKKILPEIDVIITSAFSPSKKPPLIITKKDILSLPPHCILIDMAAQYGGNIEGSKNLQTINIKKRTIYGDSNLETMLPTSASILFANNIINFLQYIYSNPKSALDLDFDDPIIKATGISKG